jgi:hypothetical protein
MKDKFNRFDELAKSVAQSVTRRNALKRFGVGLAGMALACFGLPNKAEASPCFSKCFNACCKRYVQDLGGLKADCQFFCYEPCLLNCS